MTYNRKIPDKLENRKKKKNSNGSNGSNGKTKTYENHEIDLHPRTDGQAKVIEAIEKNDITIISGPAGTGKSHLAMAYGLQQFFEGKYRRIILTRPCVEAYGESLGFLPGDFNDKILPYMRPLIDILGKYISKEELVTLIQSEFIITLPLAYQRGVAQPLTSNLVTPEGMKKMGDIRIGDDIIGIDGKKAKVVKIFPQGVIDVFRLTFSDGESVECCGNHLWLTKTLYEQKSNKDYSTKNTLDILKTFKSGQHFNHRIPVIKDFVEFDEKDVPLDPYVLGCLLGDGSLHKHASIGFSTVDKDILDRISAALPEGIVFKKAFRPCDYRIIHNSKDRRNGSPLKRILSDMDLLGTTSKNKFIPDVYKYNTENTRIEILRGLFDTDGSISNEQNEMHSSRSFFYTSSKKLAEDVVFIIQSLGGVCNVWEKDVTKRRIKPFIDGREITSKLKQYVVNPCLPKYNLFFTKRKSELFKIQHSCRSEPKRIITGIESIGKKNCQCIMVDNESHTYLTDGCVVTHNTFENAYAILDESQNTIPEQVHMFLTRMGTNSKIVITGDPNQADIKDRNGLTDAMARLDGINGISIVQMGAEDIVRHRLVAIIDKKYTKTKGSDS